MAEKTNSDMAENEKGSAFTWAVSFLFALVGAVVLAWSVFGIWTYLMPEPTSYTFKPAALNQNAVTLSGKDGIYYISLPLQQIQLIESISPLRTLEVQIALQTQYPNLKSEVVAKLPVIQDALITYLRATTMRELQESGRLFYIKEALLERINDILFPSQIQDVAFQKIVVKEGL